ncbi:ragulator complex protein LAMTOR1-like isoform X1 [Centruroides vittatus]|uniref:ragulator complex protein LAMTOR1-like isoform X1 n=1 Tax=Centruroides vittatus TaxID=120091 RepID=UPI003510C292
MTFYFQLTNNGLNVVYQRECEMGCCFSKDEDKNSQYGEPTERTTLLGNPVSNTTCRPFQSIEQDIHDKNPHGQKNDQQAAVNRILHQTACNVIDVSAMSTHHLEQHEYLDRAHLYKQRMNNAAQYFDRSCFKNSLLTDLPDPEDLLSKEPPLPNDLRLINNASDQAINALGGIKVDHKEELVVQFGIP